MHRYTCARLEQFSAQVAAGLSPRLMLFKPPRHGKSTLASICFPGWHLGRHPDHSVIQGSYGQDLSSRFSRKCRGLLKEEWYRETFPGVRLSADANTIEAWETTAGGGYKAVGVDSAVTGHGGHVLVLDDTTKNRKEAYSPAQREKVWGWYEWDIESRLAPGGGILLLQTRWHNDDLPGRLLKRDGKVEEGGLWEVIEFPAIAIQDEYDAAGHLLRRAGEALHPERYPVDCAMFVNARKNGAKWTALFQQRPTTEEGEVFKGGWWRRWDRRTLPASFDQVVLSVDANFKETLSGSFVVIQAWGQLGADFYLLHQVRGRWDFVDTVEQLRVMCRAYPEGHRKLIEEKANGAAIISTMEKKLGVGGLIPVQVEGSKVARAKAVTSYIEAGNVYIPDGEMDGFGWVDEDFLPEMGEFPGGENDDQVDALSQALNDMAGGDSWEDW